jgi:hypothetical protein
MQPSKILLALFVILTIALAALSAFEYVQLGSTKTSTQTTTQTSSIPGTLPVLRIGGTLYTYSEWNSSTPNTFTILDVKFVITANITVNYGGACYSLGSDGAYVAMTFPDGSTESMTTCIVGPSPPASIQLSNNVNPQAGLLMVPSNGTVYFLVSGTT